MGVWVGAGKAKLFPGAKSESGSPFSFSFHGTQLRQQLFSGLGLSLEQKEIESLVQLWAAVIWMD